MEYSLEQLNYFRTCRIVVKFVPAGLRTIFKREWDFLYSTMPYGTWQDTSKNGSDFYFKETKTKKVAINARYLNIMRNGNTAEWDCTCLFAAILNSNSIGTTLSPTVKTNVDHLRQVRNDIAHITEDALSDAQFQSYVARVLNAFTSLGLPINEINEIKSQTDFPTAEVKDLKTQICDLKTELDQTKSELETTKNQLQSAQDDLCVAKEENIVHTQEIHSKVQSFCFLTFTPPHEIIPRRNDLAKITKRMHELHDRNKGAVSTIYLSGNPGCGKSQLARQIGEEFYSIRSCEPDELIFVATLNAESLESLADSYITLATKLSTPKYLINELEKSKKGKLEETLKQAIRMVSKQVASFSNWLIIADNVVDLPLVRTYLPQTSSKEWGHGQVLITTQDSNTIPSKAPYTYHESLQKGMQREDALELLKQVSQCYIQEQAEEVAEVLEYQPLALAAAAFYVQTMVSGGSPNYTWTEYLDALHKGKREATEKLLAEQSVAYLQTMTAAVKMAIERAMETSDVIRETFSFLSLCALESITVETVVSFVKARLGSDKLDESIRATILRSSLIVSEEVTDGAQKYLRLHKIVGNILKTLPLFDSDSTQKLRCIATAINIYECQLNEHLSIAGYGHLHLKKISSHSKFLHQIAFPESDSTAGLLENLKPFVTPDKVVSWLIFTAKACLTVSDISQAKLLSKLACDWIQYISIETEGNLLRSLVFETHGLVLSEMGDFSSALSYQQEALDIRIKLCGEEQDDVTNSCNTLRNAFHDIGQRDHDREFYKKALNVRFKLYGDVAESYNNLGNVYADIGQHYQAKKFIERALKVRIKLYGEDHGDVAKSYNSLGCVCSDVGQHDQAKEFHERALNIRMKLYGEEHGDVADSYYNLGFLCSDIGQQGRAKEFFEKALSIRIKLYVEEHGDVAHSYYNLGFVCSDIGQHDQAKEFYEKALNIRMKLYGEEHGDVAKSYYSLGVTCLNIGQQDQAKKFHEKALNIRMKLYGEEHADVAESYYNLGVTCLIIGQQDQAKELHKKALNIRIKLYGEKHDDVAKSYNNLAKVCSDIGEHNQAKEFYEKALNIRVKLNSEEHRYSADSYFNLGCVCTDTGQYDQAKEYYKKALNITIKLCGEEHGDVAKGYYNLGCVCSAIRQHDQAKEFHEKALNIRMKLYGEKHGDVAKSYNNLGVVCSGIGQHDHAKEFHEKALNIRMKLYGEKHGDVAKSYNNLGIVYWKIGQHDQAKKFHENALNIRIKLYGEEHGDVANSYLGLGQVYSDIGEHVLAKEFFKKGRTIRRKISDVLN